MFGEGFALISKHCCALHMDQGGNGMLEGWKLESCHSLMDLDILHRNQCCSPEKRYLLPIYWIIAEMGGYC